MKKRITALVVALLMFAGVFSVQASSSETTSGESQLLIEDMLKNLGISTDFSGEHITRGEYILTLMNIIAIGEGTNAEAIYNDVKASTPLGNALYHANKLGAVSIAENFYPDNAITVNEAIKIACAILGYGELATVKGGYPYGYVAVARQLDMTNGMTASGSEPLCKDDFYILLEGFVSVPTYEIYSLSNVDGSYASSYKSNGTVLESYRDIYHIEGVLDENSVSNLYDETIAVSADSISIGDTTILGTCTDYLGMNVRAFYHKDGGKNKLVAIRPYDNEVKTLCYSDNAEFSATSVSCTDKDGKVKTYRFDSSLAVIRNGKADKGHYIANTVINDGYVELIDNNSNGRYDCVKIWEPNYLLVDKTDIVDEIIYDVNMQNVINLSKDDVQHKFNGVSSIDDILAGSCLEYTVSKDGLYYTITLLTDTIHGIVEGFDVASGAIVIGGVKYEVTDYYKVHYLANTKSGTTITAVVSSNGKLVANTSHKANEYKYGYLFRAAKTSGGIMSEYKIKICTEESEIVVLKLSDKITFNGDKTSSADAMQSLGDEQIIRYMTNSKDEVVAINTQAEENGIFDLATDDKNLLKRYYYLPEDSTKSVYYSRNGMVPTYFIVNASTKMFRVYPSDIQPDDDKRVQVATVNNLIMSNPSVSHSDLEAYNVDESGCAGAVVYRASATSSMYARASWGIVSSASNSLDSDGNKLIKLELYNADSFIDMYVDVDNPYLSSKDTIPFVPGDLIRYESLDSVTIDKFTKDYDASTHTLNYTSGNYYSSLDYFSGELDAVFSGSISFRMVEKDGSIRRAFYPVSLAKYCFVSKNGDVQTYPYSKLAGLLQSGKTYKMLLKCSDTTANQLVVYETE